MCFSAGVVSNSFVGIFFCLCFCLMLNRLYGVYFGLGHPLSPYQYILLTKKKSKSQNTNVLCAFCRNYSWNVFPIWYLVDKYPLVLCQVMAAVKIIAICQSGGKFETGQDGCLSYKGGDAHAIDIDNQMNFNDFKAEVAEMFNINLCAMSIKYFLPGNKKTLITISNDKDLQRMVKFHQDSSTVDIYILLEEALAIEVSNMPASR